MRGTALAFRCRVFCQGAVAMKYIALTAAFMMLAMASAAVAQPSRIDAVAPQALTAAASTDDEFPPGITEDEKKFLIQRRAEDAAMRKEIEQLRLSDPQAATLMENNYRNERLKKLEEYRLERDAKLNEHRNDPQEQFNTQEPVYKDPTRRQGDINDNRRAR